MHPSYSRHNTSVFFLMTQQERECTRRGVDWFYIRRYGGAADPVHAPTAINYKGSVCHALISPCLMLTLERSRSS